MDYGRQANGTFKNVPVLSSEPVNTLSYVAKVADFGDVIILRIFRGEDYPGLLGIITRILKRGRQGESQRDA